MSVLAHTSSEGAPAGGAALQEIALATGIFVVVLGGLGWWAWRERHGHQTLLGRAGTGVGKLTGLPGWVGLSGQLLRLSLLTALFGMYWDISLHIDRGRDAGPLANPGHWFILAGLTGILVAGVAAIALARELPAHTGMRLTRSWRAPVGGMLLTGCGSFALLGFPLDDLWHRLFGQDVTLFGPTHLMLIGGAALATIGGWMVLCEGRGITGVANRWSRTGEYACAGGLLIGLSTFQAEFDFGVPQFPLMLAPVMVTIAGAVALVAARRRLGPGGAIGACVFFLVVRGIIAVIVGPVLGQTTPAMPLYLGSALLVELAALVAARRQLSNLSYGVIAGGLVGTLGALSERGWNALWSATPWTNLGAETLLYTGVCGVAGGVVGAWIGAALERAAGAGSRAAEEAETARAHERLAQRPLTGTPARGGGEGRWVVAASLVLLITAGTAVHSSAGTARTGELLITEAVGGGERSVWVEVAITPAPDGPEWLQITSWQGGASQVSALREVGPGRYRSVSPIPAHGSWKSQVRLHEGDALQGLPVYLPADPAIPAPAILATSGTRSFVSDKELLQREAKEGVAGWVTLLGYGSVGALFLLALTCIGAGLWWSGRERGPGVAEDARAERITESASKVTQRR